MPPGRQAERINLDSLCWRQTQSISNKLMQTRYDVVKQLFFSEFEIRTKGADKCNYQHLTASKYAVCTLEVRGTTVEASCPRTQHIYVKRTNSNLSVHTYVPFFAGLKSHLSPLFSEVNKKERKVDMFCNTI